MSKRQGNVKKNKEIKKSMSIGADLEKHVD